MWIFLLILAIKSNVLEYLNNQDKEEFELAEDGVARLAKSTAVDKITNLTTTDDIELIDDQQLKSQLRLIE